MVAIDDSSPPQDRDEVPEEIDSYVGQVFGGRYEILYKIGQGSQARVYLARHVLIDRPVAVKCLLPVLAADKRLVARFLNEGRAAGTLGHPNIVESLDMGHTPDGVPYLVLELLQGHTLAAEIDSGGPLAPARAAYIASQIASALAATHARGIVHRDLKPENVLLMDHGGRPDHVKVLDFGISKFAGGGSRVTTIKGEPLGTPGFMAPEQIEEPQDIDSRADVYGLGATLYSMLSGEAPFAEVSFPKVLRLIVEEEPRKLGELRPELAVGLVAIVERAMSKAPAARFQTMADFEDALHAFAVEPSRVRSLGPRTARATFSTPPRARAAFSTPPHARAAFSTPPRAGAAPAAAPAAPITKEATVTFSSRARRIYGVAAALLVLALVVALLELRAKPPAVSKMHAITAAPTPAASAPAASTVAPAIAASSVAAPQPAGLAAPRSVVKSHPTDAARAQPRRSQPEPHTSPVPVPASPRGVAPSTLPPAPNCDPPFYFEGKKKLFKPDCV